MAQTEFQYDTIGIPKHDPHNTTALFVSHLYTVNITSEEMSSYAENKCISSVKNSSIKAHFIVKNN